MNDKDSQGQSEQGRIEELTRIVLRPLASPLPLAFFAFGVGTLLQSSLQLGLIPQEENFGIALILGSLVFPAMLLATVFAFLSRETMAATVLGLVSFTWLSVGVVKFATYPTPTSGAVGVLQLVIALVLVMMAAGSFSAKVLLAAVFALAAVRYGLNGFYELTASVGVQITSGIVGCLLGLVAFYGGLAFGLEDFRQQAVLPIGRGGEAYQAFQGGVSDQVGPVESETGVRKQL